MKKEKSLAKSLIAEYGGRFSLELAIDLGDGKSGEIFKWFLASKLMGARISTNTAIKTYKAFKKARVLTPQKILDKGWDGLVEILDSGGYARYDYSTATKLLVITEDLLTDYGGDLNHLHDEAENEKNLEKRLMALGKGIGPVTVNIFLRELRGVWKKAEPELSKYVIKASKDLGLPEELGALKAYWQDHRVRGKNFSDFEAALLKYARDKKLK